MVHQCSHVDVEDNASGRIHVKKSLSAVQIFVCGASDALRLIWTCRDQTPRVPDWRRNEIAKVGFGRKSLSSLGLPR